MEEKEIHLRDYVSVIINRRYIVVVFLSISVLIALLSTLRDTPMFLASGKVMFEISEFGIFKGRRQTDISYEEFFETQFQILKSPVFLKRVVTKMAEKENGLLKLPENKEKDDQDARIEIPAEKMDQLIKSIIMNIDARLVQENSNIAIISYRSDHPDVAAQMANLVIDAYIEYNIDDRLKYSKTTMDWMNKKTEEALEKLNNSELKLQKYMRENDILTLENRVAIIPQKLSQLSGHLTEVETERNEIEVVYNKIKNISDENIHQAETIPIVVENSNYKLIQEQIFRAEQKIMELSNKYGKKHPVMIRAINDLSVLENKKKETIKRIIASEKERFEMVKSKEENIRKMFLDTKKQAIELNDKFIYLEVLKKDVETNHQLYETLVSQIKEQALFGDDDQIIINVIEYAKIPSFPMASNKKKKILLGIFVGLFGGIGLAFFLEYFDQTIKSPYDVAKHFGMPVLGAIPFLKSKTSAVENIVVEEPISFQAECYKTIRMAILLSSEKHPPKCILITSHSAGDGKTTTSVNLAAAIAQTENTVLLIDGDLRRSNIHKTLKLQNSLGLSSLLSGKSQAQGVIQKGPLPNMSVITAGPTPSNPSELFCSKKMTILMDLLRDKYDYIIVDGPIMGVTDSLIISKYVDSSIVVAKAGRTTYEFLEAGITALKDIKADVMGIVINGLNQDRSKHYYYDSDDEYFSVNSDTYYEERTDEF